MDKAILVGLDLNEYVNISYQLEELENLCLACEIDTVYKITQRLDVPTPNYYVGSGKVSEIKEAIALYDANIVVFNDELSFAHIRNLEKALEIKVIDRSLLILNIFALRAKTKEAQLEIELAQMHYILPRLVGLSNSLSRQGAGFNAKGPGEKKIELDRRIIEDRIVKLNNDLKIVKNKANITRKRRLKNDIPVVALVGYTNAGKSSLMNTLLDEFNNDKKVFEKDMLFATLETFTRYIKLPNNQEFLLIDTIGFVSKLPHHLINSFESTLKEICYADLILHVVDSNNIYYNNQIDVTNNVLKALKADNIKTLYVFNKCDLLNEQFFPEYDNSILISTKTKQNINTLINIIKKEIAFEESTYNILLPYSSNLIDDLYKNEKIIKKEYHDDGIHLIANIKNKNIHKYKDYII